MTKQTKGGAQLKFDIEQGEEFPRKYLQFPIFLLSDMFNDRVKTINNILLYGVYRMANAIEYDLHEVARQTIFEHYRGDLITAIKICFNKYNFEYIGHDQDYCGFRAPNGFFEPEDEINELLQLFNHDSDLKEYCIEFYCIRQSLLVLNMTSANRGLLIESILKTGKAIQKSIPPKEVLPMVGKHILFHFRDNEKKENEVAQLLAYIAVRSIIGEKNYIKTNKQHIVARMFGFGSVKNIKNIKSEDLFNKYSKRHHIDKLLLALQLDWNICIYSNRTRGLFLSLSKYFSLQKLIEIAEQKKKSKRVNDFLEMKRNLIKDVKK